MFFLLMTARTLSSSTVDLNIPSLYFLFSNAVCPLLMVCVHTSIYISRQQKLNYKLFEANSIEQNTTIDRQEKVNVDKHAKKSITFSRWHIPVKFILIDFAHATLFFFKEKG